MFTPFDPLRGLNAATPFGSGVSFDVLRFDEHFEVHIDLPGVDPASIDLTVDGRDLTLTADRSAELPEGATLVSKGRSTGSIRRSFHLGQRLDTADVAADYADGVLKVTIPVSETAKPRKIAVGGTPAPAIETTTEAN